MFDFEWRIRRWQVWRQSAIGVSNSRNAIQRNIHSGTMPMQFISVPSMKEPESASPIAMGWPEDHQPLVGPPHIKADMNIEVESQNSTSISFTSQQSKHSIISTTSQSRENVPLPSVSRNFLPCIICLTIVFNSVCNTYLCGHQEQLVCTWYSLRAEAVSLQSGDWIAWRTCSWN